MRSLIATIFIAINIHPAWTQGQFDPKTSRTPCPGVAELRHSDLFGLWQVFWEGAAGAQSLLLEQDAQHTQGLAGAIRREGGVQTRLAGDLDEGVFTLEESPDGVRISATWEGAPVPASCGQEIRGHWTDADTGQVRDFVLRKLKPGW